MRIGLGEKVKAWDGSDVDQKTVDLLNEFYIPTTARCVNGYFLDSAGDMMEEHDSCPGYISRKDAIGNIRGGIESTRLLMALAVKRIEAAHDGVSAHLRSVGIEM